VYLRIENPIPKTTSDMHAQWQAAWESAETTVPVVRLAIENEFRKILGVSVPQAN